MPPAPVVVAFDPQECVLLYLGEGEPGECAVGGGAMAVLIDDRAQVGVAVEAGAADAGGCGDGGKGDVLALFSPFSPTCEGPGRGHPHLRGLSCRLEPWLGRSSP